VEISQLNVVIQAKMVQILNERAMEIRIREIVKQEIDKQVN